MADTSALSPSDLDLVTRTVLSEAGDGGDAGMTAVANVIRNRLQSGKYGSSPSDVVLARNQFEPWSLSKKSSNHPMKWDADSDKYKNAASLVSGVWSGDMPDITGGATHFYSPSAQTALKRKTPSWAQGQPLAAIGGHEFYAPDKGNAATAINSAIGAKPAATGAMALADETPDLLGAWSTKPSAAPAAEADTQPDLLGAWTTAAPAPTAQPVQPIPYREGELPSQTVPRWLSEHQGEGLGDRAARVGIGAMRGVGDVADTLAQGIGYVGEKGANALASTGAISPETAANIAQWHAGINRDIASDNALWSGAAKDSPSAEVGRIGGQIAATAPMLPMRLAMLPAAAPVAAAARPVLNTALQGMLAGGGTSGLTSASSDEPLATQVGRGALWGGLLGPVGQVVGQGLRDAGRGVAHALGVDSAVASLARTARDRFGIPLGPGQISSNKMLNYLNSVTEHIPFSGAAGDMAARQQAFNRAAVSSMQSGPGLKAAGLAGDNVRPEVMAATKEYLGNEIETVLPKLEAHLNPNVITRFNEITDAASYYPADDARIINKLKDDIIAQFTGVAAKPGAASRAVGPGIMAGKQIQAQIARNSPLDRAIRGSNSNVSNLASELKETLLNAVAETPTGRPKTAAEYVANLARYQQARFGWKNMKTLENIAEKSPTGDVNPALLMNEVRQSYGDMAYGGGGDMGDLARIGQRFLKMPADSGTPGRAASMIGLAKAGSVLGGAGAGLYYLDPEEFQRNAFLAAGTLAAARGASSALRSRGIANWMLNNAPGMPRVAPTPNWRRDLVSRANALAPNTVPTVYRDENAPQPASFADRFGGFRAQGGPVAAGMNYMVGENGPEIVTLGDPVHAPMMGMAPTTQQQQALAASPYGAPQQTPMMQAAAQSPQQPNALGNPYGQPQPQMSAPTIGNDSTNNLLSQILKLFKQQQGNGIQSPLLNALSSSGGIYGSQFGGARADGGPVEGGKQYLVGENGPELVTMPSDGTVTPNPDYAATSDAATLAAAKLRRPDLVGIARSQDPDVQARMEALAKFGGSLLNPGTAAGTFGIDFAQRHQNDPNWPSALAGETAETGVGMAPDVFSPASRFMPRNALIGLDERAGKPAPAQVNPPTALDQLDIQIRDAQKARQDAIDAAKAKVPKSRIIGKDSNGNRTVSFSTDPQALKDAADQAAAPHDQDIAVLQASRKSLADSMAPFAETASPGTRAALHAGPVLSLGTGYWAGRAGAGKSRNAMLAALGIGTGVGILEGAGMGGYENYNDLHLPEGSPGRLAAEKEIPGWVPDYARNFLGPWVSRPAQMEAGLSGMTGLVGSAYGVKGPISKTFFPNVTRWIGDIGKPAEVAAPSTNALARPVSKDSSGRDIFLGSAGHSVYKDSAGRWQYVGGGMAKKAHWPDNVAK